MLHEVTNTRHGVPHGDGEVSITYRCRMNICPDTGTIDRVGLVDWKFDCGAETGGPQGFVPGDTPDWIILGGESGPNARPCNVEWVRDTVRQCKAAGVAVFVASETNGRITKL